MHGVKIDLVQSGVLGSFSFSQLLVSLTTSLTLLAVSTVIVDYAALYLLPDKDRYDAAKNEWTEDFGDLRDADEDKERLAKQRAERGLRPTNVDSLDLSFNGGERLLSEDVVGYGKTSREQQMERA
jgi:hypothetical protein